MLEQCMTISTRKALIEALERLVDGTPNNLKLRKKARIGKLKINNSTVEKEAELSVGALRRHDDIKDMITKKSLNTQVEKSDSANSEIDLLLQQNKKLISDKTSLNHLKEKYFSESKAHIEALSRQAAIHIKMVQELMDMIPEIEREKAMDKVVKARPDNLIEGKFR
jgi:hypothetical protein